MKLRDLETSLVRVRGDLETKQDAHKKCMLEQQEDLVQDLDNMKSMQVNRLLEIDGAKQLYEKN